MNELVLAWAAWERWCASNQKAYGRRRGDEGRFQSARLVAAEKAVAGDGRSRLHDAVAAGRRAGLSVEQAVAAAASDNGHNLSAPF